MSVVTMRLYDRPSANRFIWKCPECGITTKRTTKPVAPICERLHRPLKATPSQAQAGREGEGAK